MGKWTKEEKEEPKLKAKRDFHLYCPPKIDLHIKKGDDLKDVPKSFLNGLKIEKVI